MNVRPLLLKVGDKGLTHGVTTITGSALGQYAWQEGDGKCGNDGDDHNATHSTAPTGLCWYSVAIGGAKDGHV